MVHADKRMIKGEQTRTKILYAAIEVIAENGLKNVSTAKLATVAGVSKSTIFHHFQSSDEVMKSTLDFVYHELLKDMKTEQYRDIKDLLDGIGYSLFHVPDEELSFFKVFLSFFHEGVFDSTYRDVFISYVNQMNDFFRMQLTKLAPESTDQDRIDRVSKLLLPIIDGVGLHYLLDQDRKKYQQLWNLQAKGIMDMLYG